MTTVILYARFLHKPSAVSLRNYLTVSSDLHLSSVRRQENRTVLVRITLNWGSLVFLNLKGNVRNISKCFQAEELNLWKKNQQDSFSLVKTTFPTVLQLITHKKSGPRSDALKVRAECFMSSCVTVHHTHTLMQSSIPGLDIRHIPYLRAAASCAQSSSATPLAHP